MPREVEVERLVLREPGTGRIRAVLETAPAGQDPDDRATYRLRDLEQQIK